MNRTLTSTSFPNGAGPLRTEAEARADIARQNLVAANDLYRALFSSQFKGAPRTPAEEEQKAAAMFFKALADFRSAVRDAQTFTTLFKDRLEFGLEAIPDFFPDKAEWDEKIAENTP
jgi:hypothetical protein